MTTFQKLFLTIGTTLLSLLVVSVAFSAGLTDTSITDFTGGDAGSCYVGPSTDDGVDGEVTLLPTTASDFSSGLPAGWITQTWQPGGTIIVSGGRLTATNAVAYGALVSAPASIEFMAVFTTTPYQHGGLVDGTGFGTYAMFSTQNGGDLYARTTNILTGNIPLGPGYLAVWQRYRIDWTSAGVTYYINDSQVNTETVSLMSSLRPLFSDNNDQYGSNPDTEPFIVDWFRMGPYSPTSCTFTSRLIDSANTAADWTTLSANTYAPAGTSLSFQTRSGNITDTNDSSWSAWEDVVGGAIASPTSRYLQYRVTMTTTDALATPRVYSVDVNENPTAVALLNLTAVANNAPGSAWLLLAIGVTMLGGTAVMRRMTRTRSTARSTIH